MNFKRLTLFCGHYGSGKTNIAVNYALYLRSLGKDTVIGDLDIVNRMIVELKKINGLQDVVRTDLQYGQERQLNHLIFLQLKDMMEWNFTVK